MYLTCSNFSITDGYREVTIDAITNFFDKNTTKMVSLHSEIEDLSLQMHKEQIIVSELNDTISELKQDLNKAQGNISNMTSLRDSLESQHQKTNDTLLIQVYHLYKVIPSSNLLIYFQQFCNTSSELKQLNQ